MEQVSMEEIVSLAKRRGFIFPAGELYGGLAGIYDYGPLGALLKHHVKELWLDHFVFSRDDMYLIDAAIVMGEDALTASGHVGGFSDPLIQDLKTGKEYRLDHLLEEAGVDVSQMDFAEMEGVIREKGIRSPEGNELGNARAFNLMLKTQLGASSDSSSTAYLRPETAQGIFVNYKNIMDALHPKIPFGVAQIGKAYRNEITPRNFIFRLREFEQMEIEYFIHPESWEEWFPYWQEEMRKWIERIGLRKEWVVEREQEGEELAHYSKRTIDFEFHYPFGQKELYGLAYRTDYDLAKHAKASKEKLEYHDPHTNERYIPHVIEPSMGLDRTILAMLVSAYRKDEIDGKERVYLAFPPYLAPYRVSVSPLLRNKPELVEKAREVYRLLKGAFKHVAWDDHGNIGKRYRRQDEIGTPFVVVIDYDTVGEGETRDTVTVRFRDTGEQERVALPEIVSFLSEQFERA